MYYILHLSAQIASQLSPVYIGTCFYLSIWHFKNHSGRKVFRNLNLGNLENVLQRNVGTDGARECIFRASEGTSFQNLSVWRQPWCFLHVFDDCTCLPKKTLDTSLIPIKSILHLLYLLLCILFVVCIISTAEDQMWKN